jgi:hypothetical protein
MALKTRAVRRKGPPLRHFLKLAAIGAELRGNAAYVSKPRNFEGRARAIPGRSKNPSPA